MNRLQSFLAALVVTRGMWRLSWPVAIELAWDEAFPPPVRDTEDDRRCDLCGGTGRIQAMRDATADCAYAPHDHLEDWDSVLGR